MSELRDNVRLVLEEIYNAFMRDEDVQDDISDELGDFYDSVQESGDEGLQVAYASVRALLGEDDEDIMGTVMRNALSAIKA